MRISDWSSTCALPIYRADLISGGDAPLDIVTPAGVDSASVTMSLNGKDVSGAFASTEDGTLRGLVTGLDVGDNTFKVQYPGGRAQTTLVDHPNGGPILRSEEHTSELQSLMRIPYAGFCLNKKQSKQSDEYGSIQEIR